MRIVLIAVGVVVAALAVYLTADFTSLSHWVVEQQRGFQDQMASAVQSIRAGEVGALAALLAATGAYGFVHALGPGHGKYLVGGVGLGTAITSGKLIGLAAISSLAQALWAIVLVYGGFALLEVSAQHLTTLAEDILAPASYLAIGAVGLILMRRGLLAFAKRHPAVTAGAEVAAGHHSHSCGCGHAHGPTAEEAARVGSLKEALGLIGSIAVRPCTGAVFLLVITWQMDIKLAGALAILVMGLGTAALTGLVALSSVAARRLALASADGSATMGVVFPAGQIFAGALVLWISLGLLAITI